MPPVAPFAALISTHGAGSGKRRSASASPPALHAAGDAGGWCATGRRPASAEPELRPDTIRIATLGA
jgi:hypothetical protein